MLQLHMRQTREDAVDAHLSEIQSRVSRDVLSSSQASLRGQKKYSVKGLRCPCITIATVERNFSCYTGSFVSASRLVLRDGV